MDDFQTYVDFLCRFAREGHEEVHAIAMSSSGKFFRMVGKTFELREILGPKVYVSNIFSTEKSRQVEILSNLDSEDLKVEESSSVRKRTI